MYKSTMIKSWHIKSILDPAAAEDLVSYLKYMANEHNLLII